MVEGLFSPVHLLVILVVALIVLGPQRLPDAARHVGRALAELRAWTNDASAQVQEAVQDGPERGSPPSAEALGPPPPAPPPGPSSASAPQPHPGAATDPPAPTSTT